MSCRPVSLFSHAAIASLNNLEMMVYQYVIKNRDKVMYMTIRELADAAGVSTTTVLRFCRKLQCDGYSEFRVRFKLYLEQSDIPQQLSGASDMLSFFRSVNNEEFEQQLDEMVEVILASERIIFVGAGTSGALAKYGARFFSNVGKFSNHIDDPYFPVTNDMAKNALAIVLSVSGETEEILRFAGQFSLHRCKVLSITCHEQSRLAKLADYNISWHMTPMRIGGVYDITTQIPVVYILESLGRKLAKKLSA
ncbi:MurR/RpiR family transcriptional regulator [Pluralibacter gergoviae]|nr:MurR/RpiR family transcriptional regulator [Pluralibacter gergoviae]EKV3543523.1 MurR/RpiR family transcriptional regulator [Pluralibacter gergoviae]EKV9897422.1 MurR/RpiR family transcriptional regulator [Pluralibacter gergoviae]EKV9929899.1 MurR/RpiR family transcriptional regulator [Pluralibacter gergoviae]EKW9975534.1 MurR/RpiR family transcriptional regulator [Pluralibacter gergoviae]